MREREAVEIGSVVEDEFATGTEKVVLGDERE